MTGRHPGLERALDGVTVLDLSRLYPGPFATQVLADLGARVIKVEPPAGDLSRWMEPHVGGVGHVFAAVNRGKESITADLRTGEGVHLVRRLAERADVLVESFRPGVLADMGLAPDDLRAANPRLVVASLSGYGQDGPLRDAPGHDVNYQAYAGILGMTPGSPLPGAQVADATGALYAVIAILAQLRTGEGAHLDVALTDAAFSVNLLHLAHAAAGAATSPAATALTGNLPGYGVYDTADGKRLALGCLEPKFWGRFVEAAGATELEEHGLGEGDPEALAATRRVVAARTLDEWAAILDAHEVPWAPVLLPHEALAHPHVAARGHDGRPGGPLGLPKGRRAPELGEHDHAVRAELDREPPP